MTKVFLCSNSKHPSPSTALLQGIASIPRQSRGKRVQIAACGMGTLFSLRHLRMLDLSYNDFRSSHIPPQFGQFSNLTYLHLKFSGFAGQVPSEFSLLSKLDSLDLSANYHPSLEPISFDKLAQNLTQLRELRLSRVNMSLVAPDSLMNLSSSLSSLILYSCGLQGKLPSSMRKFKNLQYLNLGDNIQNTHANRVVLAFVHIVSETLVGRGSHQPVWTDHPTVWDLGGGPCLCAGHGSGNRVVTEMDMSRNRRVADNIRVGDDQDDVPIVRLRNTRQRRGGAPAPQYVEEIPHQ
uniref:Leucine-rich repeat-containing N-terminal plant-type domain-containing protein n=1 Tax=Salix viminalis TaxID=40686 RepID=A0A6N2LT47_SALVM